MNDVGWLDDTGEEIRRSREELARVREASAASVNLLQNKARSGLSPAFSPSVQEFVANVMAGGLTTSSFSGGPLSGRTPLGPGNERTPTTPGGGDFLRTPRTAGGGAANPSSSLRTKGALGFIKDEAVRLRGGCGVTSPMSGSASGGNSQMSSGGNSSSKPTGGMVRPTKRGKTRTHNK